MQNIMRLRKCVRPIDAVTKKCIIAGKATTNSAISIINIAGDNTICDVCHNVADNAIGDSNIRANEGKRYTNAVAIHKGVITPRRAAKKDLADNFPLRAG